MKAAGIILLLFLPLISLAQTADSAKVKDTVMYYLKGTTTGSINKTNDGKTFISNNNLKFNIIKSTMNLNSSNSWIYGAQTAGLTNNDFSSALDFNMFRSKRKVYYWGLATYDKSFSLRINNRVQTGIGIGYTFINTLIASISLSDGFIYEYNDLYKTQESNADYETVRNSLRLKYRFSFKDVVILDGMHFWQPSVFDIEDYIIKSNSTISIKLKTWLSITTAIIYNKVNATNKETLLVNYGLTFEKTF